MMMLPPASMIQACRRGDFKGVRRVVDLMRRHGISDLTTHCFLGDLAYASRAMEEIEQEGLGADMWTYDELVLSACKAGRIRVAMKLLRRLEEGVEHTGSKDGDTYCGRDNTLDRKSYEVVANELIRLRKMEEAKKAMEKMTENGLFMGFGLKNQPV